MRGAGRHTGRQPGWLTEPGRVDGRWVDERMGVDELSGQMDVDRWMDGRRWTNGWVESVAWLAGCMAGWAEGTGG